MLKESLCQEKKGTLINILIFCIKKYLFGEPYSAVLFLICLSFQLQHAFTCEEARKYKYQYSMNKTHKTSSNYENGALSCRLDCALGISFNSLSLVTPPFLLFKIQSEV